MKKLSLLIGSTILLLLVPIAFTYATSKLSSLAIKIENLPEYTYTLSKEQDTQLTEGDNLTDPKRTLEIGWQANFLYPYQSDQPKEIFINQADLPWQWQENGSNLTGTSTLESCPITLEYRLEGKTITSNVSFTNITNATIENLEYSFILKHPSSFKIDTGSLIVSGALPFSSFTINSPEYTGVLTNLYEGEFLSASKYAIQIGDISPGKTNNITITMSYN